jgi:peroxiredoxin
MSRTVRLGDQEFSLAGHLPAIGETVSLLGEGLRVLYLAPSFERWPIAEAKAFSDEVLRLGGHADLQICSADYQPIRDAWAAAAGWRAVRFDKAMIQSLGLWLDTLSLPARALLILDGTGRLRHCQFATRLEDEVAFDDALLALKTLV